MLEIEALLDLVDVEPLLVDMNDIKVRLEEPCFCPDVADAVVDPCLNLNIS